MRDIFEVGRFPYLVVVLQTFFSDIRGQFLWVAWEKGHLVSYPIGSLRDEIASSIP